MANLPPVSTTLVKLVEKFAAGVVDTGGKFAAVVVDTSSNDTGGKFAAGVVDTGGAPWIANTVYRQIFKKIWIGLNGILWGWGELIHEKNLKQKISCTVPLS